MLILGGTGEAARLAELLSARSGLDVTTSLAGRTRTPAALAGRVRVGGFGGVAGLVEYLRTQNIDAVVDATHPYAHQISSHAAHACQTCGIARVQLWRPPWKRQDGDTWFEVPTMNDAAQRVVLLWRAAPGRVFLTTGIGELAAFSGLHDIEFLLRLIDKTSEKIPLPRYELLLGRGPYSEEAELELFTERGVTQLVSKHSGGSATYAKIAAARRLRLPVVMLQRPPAQPGPVVHDVDAACRWVFDWVRW